MKSCPNSLKTESQSHQVKISSPKSSLIWLTIQIPLELPRTRVSRTCNSLRGILVGRHSGCLEFTLSNQFGEHLLNLAKSLSGWRALGWANTCPRCTCRALRLAEEVPENYFRFRHRSIRTTSRTRLPKARRIEGATRQEHCWLGMLRLIDPIHCEWVPGSARLTINYRQGWNWNQRVYVYTQYTNIYYIHISATGRPATRAQVHCQN